MTKLMPKEISWLSFNGRVLQEAADPSVPLLERVRFLGIYSNNQDEFFKVRVAELKRQVIINRETGTRSNFVELLRKVQNTANQYQNTLNAIYKDLLGELAKHRIYLHDEKEITESQREWVRSFFKKNVLKHINPVIIDEDTDLISFLKDQYTYLFARMTGEDKSDVRYALIEIPTDQLPRFIRLPSDDDSVTLMFLDNVIRIGLDAIFKGLFSYKYIEAYSIKLNRDAEYDLSDSMDKSLLENMSESIKQRLNAMPVRFAYDAAMPESIVTFMAHKLHMSSIDSLMPGARYHNFKDFLSFPSTGEDNLENPALPGISSSQFDSAINAFEAIAKGDILLYYPYYYFDYFTEFLRQASYDPAVTSIKINIYRVASHSRVINSLIDAANNGKSVTVVVELKARFDEANNIKWASRLTEAGVKVLFGLPTLKIHSKLCLITRKENDQLVRYAHIGTGNFNEKTAKIYTDFALFTANPELTLEVESVFEFIEYPYTRPEFRHLLVSPINARSKITAMIDREIQNAKLGREAYIHLKVNNLVDTRLIEKLYEASCAGVKIRAVIRGMCSLVPGVKDLSENIYITSIVDRFLEHPRVMIFCNDGNEELYISSADWMTRNLDYRIEVGTPILDPVLRARIRKIIDLQENDNRKARVIDEEQKNVYVSVSPNTPKIRSQIEIHNFLINLEKSL
ncbi:MAG TPA: polyphosphate kinase 1 [Succinivibrionaceae bacterium]|nr:polyphosphate kinase 1 [Succinivibrionaceae bacterium]